MKPPDEPAILTESVLDGLKKGVRLAGRQKRRPR